MPAFGFHPLEGLRIRVPVVELHIQVLLEEHHILEPWEELHTLEPSEERHNLGHWVVDSQIPVVAHIQVVA